MKRTLLSAFTVLSLLTGGQAMAQSNVPQVINFQAVARDAGGQLVAGQTITVRITIRQNSANGQALYCGTYNANTNAYGSFSVQLNRNAVLTNCNAATLDFAGIPWETGAKYAQIEYQAPGGSSFVDVATLEVASVPYAMAATTAERAQSVNGISTAGATVGQGLVYNNNTSRFEPTTLNTGTTYAAGAGIGISGGVISNTGDLLTDNEIQTLSLSGNNLTLSRNGGSVTLPSGGGTNYWSQTGVKLFNNNSYGANVGINKRNPGADYALDILGNTRVTDRGFRYGSYLVGPGVGIADTATESWIANMAITANGGGYYRHTTPTGGISFTMSTVASKRSNPYMVLSDSGRARLFSYVTTTTSQPVFGLMRPTYAGSGGDLTQSSMYFYSEADGSGSIVVQDGTGADKAGIFIDATGQGTIYGDVKNFRMKHPTQPGKEIWYASLEGPEAAAYTRGTATLRNGKVTIEFPEHFATIVAEKGMTIQLTPGSADSKGLAVVTKSTKGFEVRELANGTGTYTFDWEAKAVRAGYENYQTVRDASAKKGVKEKVTAATPVSNSVR